jgi:hypothetical protein
MSVRSIVDDNVNARGADAPLGGRGVRPHVCLGGRGNRTVIPAKKIMDYWRIISSLGTFSAAMGSSTQKMDPAPRALST